jgi:hypothetical protein
LRLEKGAAYSKMKLLMQSMVKTHPIPMQHTSQGWVPMRQILTEGCCMGM